MRARSRAHRRTAAGALLVALVAGALAVLPATSASAHDYLVDSTPEAGSVQTKPISTVTLTFNDRILDLGGDGNSAIMQVTGPGKRHFETGCPTILDRVLSAPVSLGPAGAYTVTWQIVSADGHTVSASIGFTYTPPAGTVAGTGTANGPACGRTESASTQPPGTSDQPTGSQPNELGLVLGIAIGIVVLALAGVLIVVLTARRRPKAPPS